MQNTRTCNKDPQEGTNTGVHEESLPEVSWRVLKLVGRTELPGQGESSRTGKLPFDTPAHFLGDRS